MDIIFSTTCEQIKEKNQAKKEDNYKYYGKSDIKDYKKSRKTHLKVSILSNNNQSIHFIFLNIITYKYLISLTSEKLKYRNQTKSIEFIRRQSILYSSF